MIKWTGQPTNRVVTWTETAETFQELYHKLIDRKTISIEDGYPDEKYMLKKVGLKIEDFDNVEEEWDYDYMKWFEEKTKEIELTEEDYAMIINSEKGNAYYQTVEII